MSRTFSAATLASALTLFAAEPATAQHHGDGGSGANGAATGGARSPSPYAGMETRRVKALSDGETADLEAGRGMGLALAAELNDYPGPLHVLELAGSLGLTDEQASLTRNLLDRMKAETMPIGKRIIEGETVLDGLFAGKSITPATLDDAVKRIAAAQGELRAAHLRYHLEMAELLSAEQTALYAKLRGYSGSAS